MSFQTCNSGDDSICKDWFGATALENDYCCWRFEIMEIPTEYSDDSVKDLATRTLENYKKARLASQVGEVSHVCMNGWSRQYPNGIPPEYTWVDSQTEIKVRGHCDKAASLAASVGALLLSAFYASY